MDEASRAALPGAYWVFRASRSKIQIDFNGNQYKLVAMVRYQLGILPVEWIGTHAEYDKRSF